MIRYKATFKDDTQYSLYGEDYFNDKAIFWRHHQSNLVNFSNCVAEKGRPVNILDTYSNTLIELNSPDEFDIWYRKNQSSEFEFGFSDCDSREEIYRAGIERSNKMIEFLKQEIKALEKEHFDIWRIEGGYKEFATIINTSLRSLENIKKKSSQYEDLINKLETIFNSLLVTALNGHNIIDYSNKGKEIIPGDLLKLCQLNLDILLIIQSSIM